MSMLFRKHFRTTMVLALVVGAIALALVIRKVAQDAAHRRYMDAQTQLAERISTMREWPAFRDPSIGGVTATLRTACRTPGVVQSGRFHYQLRLEPADSVHRLLYPTLDSSAQSAPQMRPADTVVESADVRSLPEEDREFLRRRRIYADEMSRSMALGVTLHRSPALAVEFLDNAGFRVHEFVVPTDSLEATSTTEPAALVANRIREGFCGPDVLEYASWRLRVVQK